MGLLAAVAVLAGLTACSGSDTLAGCAPTVHSGDASSVVKAPGALNSAPKVNFPTPLFARTTEKSTVIAGHGAVVTSGQPVVVDVTILNGRTQTVLQKTSYVTGGGSLITAGTSSFPAISEALECSTVGSRIAVVASPKDGHGAVADVANGIKKNDSFVYVIDVKRAFLSKANGSRVAQQNGLPIVVTTANGTPGISVPVTDPPKSAQTKQLQRGSGAVVKGGDYVIAQYTGVTWSTEHSVFDSTWKAGQATVIQVGGTSMSTGLSAAIEGQRVGSQILAVLPAKDAVIADGSGSVPQGETVVYVVDILGIAQ